MLKSLRDDSFNAESWHFHCMELKHPGLVEEVSDDLGHHTVNNLDARKRKRWEGSSQGSLGESTPDICRPGE